MLIDDRLRAYLFRVSVKDLKLSYHVYIVLNMVAKIQQLRRSSLTAIQFSQ